MFVTFVNVMLQAIECYMWAVLQKHKKTGRLFLLNHFVTGVILHGTRQEMARQALPNVSSFHIYIYLNMTVTFNLNGLLHSTVTAMHFLKKRVQYCKVLN